MTDDEFTADYGVPPMGLICTPDSVCVEKYLRNRIVSDLPVMSDAFVHDPIMD